MSNDLALSLIKSSDFIFVRQFVQDQGSEQQIKQLRDPNDKCHRDHIPGDGGGSCHALLRLGWCHRHVF